LERWLHQHIFKVGWLVTKNFHTTTIFYYTFLMPGVVLHEISLWFMAGIMNVRAERAIQWPEAQEIAELRLNFIKLSKNAPPLKVAIISIMPLIAGLGVVWFIANNVLNIQGFLDILSSGQLEDVGAAVNLLTSTPDFWLWVYLLFAISNTMMPRFENLRGGRIILIIIAVILVALFVLGVGDDVVVSASAALNNGASILAGAFAVIIGFNLVMVAILGTVEAIIERITGDSATFRNGKLIAMRRSEILALREQEAKKAQAASKKSAPVAAPAGPPTIYKFPLPVPGAPGAEPITRRETVIVEPEAKPALSSPTDDRRGPAFITGAARPTGIEVPAPKPGLPQPPLRPSASIPAEDDEPEEDEEPIDETDDVDEDADDEDNSDDLTYEDAEEPA
jgi:hypothetical protein